MAERIEKGDNAKSKGGTGYTARRWRTSWVFDCSASKCGVNADERATIERHVLVKHGVVQAGESEAPEVQAAKAGGEG